MHRKALQERWSLFVPIIRTLIKKEMFVAPGFWGFVALQVLGLLGLAIYSYRKYRLKTKNNNGESSTPKPDTPTKPAHTGRRQSASLLKHGFLTPDGAVGPAMKDHGLNAL